MVELLKGRAKRYLTDLPAEYVFHCVNGRIPGKLKEIEAEIKSVSEQDYACHINARNNNFSNRVRDIINDNSLVKTLLNAFIPTQAANYMIAGMSDLSKAISR